MGLKAEEVYFTGMSGLPAIESSGNVRAINYAVNLWIRAGPCWLGRSPRRSFEEDFIWLMNGVELHLLSRRDKKTFDDKTHHREKNVCIQSSSRVWD